MNILLVQQDLDHKFVQILSFTIDWCLDYQPSDWVQPEFEERVIEGSCPFYLKKFQSTDLRLKLEAYVKAFVDQEASARLLSQLAIMDSRQSHPVAC